MTHPRPGPGELPTAAESARARTVATVRAPLKLVLAGEYAVLDDRGEAVVAAIDRYVEARAERIQNAPGAGEPRCEVSAPGLWEGAIELSGPDPATGALDREALGPEDAERLRFAGEALALGYQYLAELGLPLSPVRLRVDSRAGTLEAPTGERRKLGLGTSAASVVATLGALLAVHGVPIDRPTFRNSLLRIAIAAHTTVQGGRGSGVDVAAAVTGGVVCYRRCNTRFQKTLFDQNPSALEIARSGWPGLLADSTVVSKNIRLLIGFTGRSSDTVDRVQRFSEWASANPDELERFIARSRTASRMVRLGVSGGHREVARDGLRGARAALQALARAIDVEIETSELAALADSALEFGIGAKLSGAGGGDCGIALVFDPEQAQQLAEAWVERGIVPVPARISLRGLHELPREVATSEVAMEDAS